MSNSITAVWDELTQHVAARWQIPPGETEGQMVAVIRHAIYDPALALVISTAGLLLMTPPVDTAVTDWVTACQSAGQEWLRRYRLLEHRCVQGNTAVPTTCQCILNQLAPLFANSHPLAQTGQRLFSQYPAMHSDEAYDMLLRALGRLARLSAECQQNDLSWLWEYIDAKTY
jgi:hypothetical protein